MSTLGPLYFSNKPNLANPRLGAKVIYASDEFFASKDRLINPKAPVFIEDKYDQHGKWMDGWETRRKRSAGYDYCIIKLGGKAKVNAIEIDTAFFTGNYPAAASIDACFDMSTSDDLMAENQNIEWHELMPTTTLSGNQSQIFQVDSEQTITHLRLNIYPDGGVARLRVYGQALFDWHKLAKDQRVDLLSMDKGSRPIVTNDEHYGSIANLTLPDKGLNMGDGWETRRRREPGNDWAIFQLGHSGEIEEVEVDTAFFKGNFPSQCSIQGAFVDACTDESLVTQSMFWQELLPPEDLSMDNVHRFNKELKAIGKISHIRFNIFPDGGISRLRLLGKI